MVVGKLKTFGGWLREKIAVASHDHEAFFGITRTHLRSAITEFFHLLEMTAVIGAFTAAGLWSHNELVKQISVLASLMLVLYIRSWFPFNIVKNVDWKSLTINSIYNFAWLLLIFYLGDHVSEALHSFVYVALQLPPMP